MTDMEVEKSIGEQMVDLLQEDPQHYDVVFNVGPENIKIKAVRFILRAASPVFNTALRENWESAVMKESDGIPLPDVNPVAFELFLHLIISDKWSVDALTNLNLTFATMLNLLELCRRFEITKGISNLEDSADRLMLTVKDSQGFLEMSQENVKTILSCEAIPLDEKEVFECACRWAEHQCNQKKMQLTGENFREVLGSCIFEIRFPTMKFEIFTKISNFKKNLFTAEEKIAIYDFIGLDDDEKDKFDKTLLPFKTNPRCPRNSFGCSVLRLPQQFKITANPPFVCNRNNRSNYFQVNKKIALHGIGFLGPINGDTCYVVKLTFFNVYGTTRTSRSYKKHIFARKERNFHFLFDEPIVIEPNACDTSWRKYCFFYYRLKGASNVLQYKTENPKYESVQISGVEFNLDSSWSDQPVAELLYKLN